MPEGRRAVSLGDYGDGDGDRRGQRHRVDGGARRRRPPPLSFELIAGGRSNLTFRVTRRRGPNVRAAPPAREPRAAHGARHGARAHHYLGPLSGGHPRRAAAGTVHRRGGQRAALLRHGVRRGRHPARSRPGRGGLRLAPFARTSATTSPRPSPSCTRSTSRASGSATSPDTTATSSVSCAAGADSSSRRAWTASITRP